MTSIGIDFGGTKIEVAALDSAGDFLMRHRVANPGRYDLALEAVRDLVLHAEREVGAQGTVGIGVPGSVSPRTGVMRNANATWLNGRQFKEDIELALGRPVRLANDANCLALSESVDGSGAGARTVFAVILGTGCGGGMVVDGRLQEGANGVGGEWGHIPLPWPTAEEFPGPECWCGHRGCLETWVSGSGLRRDHEQAGGRAATCEEIVAAAQAGDVIAVRSLERYFDRLGRALAVVCNIVDPEVFVFGGGMSNVAALYQRLPELIAPHVFSDGWSARLLPARWGDSSGVRGAARLWQEQALMSSAGPSGDSV